MKNADYYTLLPKPPSIGRALPTAVDLFSGAGGISLGLVNAGFNVVFASDIDEACGKTHELNFNQIPFHTGDVCHLTGKQILQSTGLKKGELDLLMGGPPCQGFSIIGARLLEDPRNRLFLQFMRIATELKPKALVIENVPGLATIGGGSVLEAIANAYEEAGYTFECEEMLAAHFGVPQMRWRMFMVGFRRDLKIDSSALPTRSHGNYPAKDLRPNKAIPPAFLKGFLTTGDAIRDLPPVSSGQEVSVYTNKPTTTYQKAMRAGLKNELYNHYAPKLSGENLARIKALKPGEDWRDLPRALLPESMQRALRKDHTRRYRRMTWDGVPRSIITRFRDPKSGEYSHPEQVRTISIREAARIQSFPDWFQFQGPYTKLYDQVGNAVPPLLARALGAEIRKTLEDAKAGESTLRRGRQSLQQQPSLFPNSL